MPVKKKSSTHTTLGKQTNTENVLSTARKNAPSVRHISILFAGIHDIGELIRMLLQDKFNESLITLEIANNSDDTLWWIEDIKNSLIKSHHDVCILYLNNVVSERQGVRPPVFKSRMESVCKLIKDLTASTSTKVIGIYGPDDDYWPKRVIEAGAQAVYYAPFSNKRFVENFPIVMGWKKRRILKE